MTIIRKIRKHHHINKKYLEKEYIKKSRSAYEIAQENKVKAKLIIQRLHRFGISCRTIKEATSTILCIEKRKKTCFQKYGVDNPSKNKNIINKIQRNRDKITHARNVSISLRKRTKQQWIESSIKRSKTLLSKYGVINLSQLPSVKKNMRLSAIKRISKQKFNGGQVYPRYNIEACKHIDEYGKQHGYNFQHAENGGEFYIKELGYWVDGYDKKKNVVIEYDEPHHFNENGQLKKEDIERQILIENHLGCKFIRIK